MPTDSRLQRMQCLADMLSQPDRVRIVDIGANPMYFDAPYKRMLESGFCHLTGFEPQADALEKLNASKGPNETYFNAALGDGAKHDLHVYRGSGLTSLLKIKELTLSFLRGLRRAARPVDVFPVATQRLDDLKEIGRIDFLKIDIQGAELSVMEHGKTALRSVVAIQTEVSFFPLYENQPSFGEIDVFLRQQGFVPHSFLHIEKRLVLSRKGRALGPGNGSQMLDGDILYLRDLSATRNLSTESLCRLALLADGVFELPDITLRCLDVLEQRNHIKPTQVDHYFDLVIETVA